MALKLEDKKAIVADVAKLAQQALSVVAADYRGLTVAQMTELRSAARSTGVKMRVVRNTLARRAFEGTSFACMDEALTGPLILAFTSEDPGAAARLFRDYIKKFEKLEVKALSVDGKLLAAKDLNALASLPTRDEAISKLMSVMLAPVTKLVCTMNAIPSKLVRTIDAVRDQKQQAA